MKTTLSAVALILAAGPAFAAGLDRSGQGIGVLFEEGTWAEFSAGFVYPSTDGVGILGALTGVDSGNVGDDYIIPTFGLKGDISDDFSFALIADEPFAGNVTYTGPSFFTGTTADVGTMAVTALGQANLGNGFSLHGGPRIMRSRADVTLSGAGYGSLSGYNFSGQSDWETGYVVGAAYEKPEIALRAALTYSSEIDVDLDSKESIAAAAATTSFTSPASVNFDFQTGVMADTLLFGSVRYVEWDGFNVTPGVLNLATGASLVSYDEDRFTYSLGLGRRFTDELSAAISFGYEPDIGGLNSALGPTDGYKSIGLGGTYTADSGVKVSGGARYILPGDADVGSSGTNLIDFSDNSALAFGFKIGVPINFR